MRIGIDLGGTKTEGVLLAADDTVVARERRPTPQAQGYDAIVAGIRDLVTVLEARAGHTCTVGIGTPGSLSTRGLLKNSNTTCLNGRPFKANLERTLARTIRIENDANCFALSEARTGAARGARTVFGIIMGTGVGGGIVVDGAVLRGRHDIAGEWGHNVLDASGSACYCGRRGCVETWLSGPAVVHDYRAHGGAATVTTVEDIVARAADGETTAVAALDRLCEHFGQALATVVNILDPDAVVLGGGLAHIARLYTDGRSALARHVFNDEFTTPIVANAHGDSSGVLGAAQLWPARAD